MKRLLLVSALFIIPAIYSKGQEWTVPEDKKGKLSPFRFNDDTRKAGEKLYFINCKSCHGNPGKGNTLALVPPPPDPATDRVQKNRDGELFYKISEGKGPMPSFKNVLSSNEIWNIISFLRTFKNNYSQEIMPVIKSSAYPGAEIKLLLEYTAGDTAIRVRAEAFKDNMAMPVHDAGVRLYVHRTFGQLPIQDEVTTDKNGFAAFRIPDNLPGDTAGNIRVSARFTNEDLFGTEGKDTVLKAGTKTIPVSLVRDRAMWNVVRKAPVWILLTFSLGVILVWGFIIFALMKLRDIYILGDALSSDRDEKKTN
jgi:hypothetical protein